MIVIIDYGMGNLRSVINKFNKLNVQATVSSDINVIDKADKLVLPGVGHFSTGMKKLKELELIDILSKKVLKNKTPILGICLGMQLFSKFSEEGNVEGLGWIKAKTKKFNFIDKLNIKIPHMGWNNLEIKKQSNLLKYVTNEDYFYFVHSYYVICDELADELSSTEYGICFTSSIEKDNIFGTQFHPEKSHDSGIKIIKNFIDL